MEFYLLSHPRLFGKLSAILTFVCLSSTFAAAAVSTVNMKSLSYDPKNIEIKNGDSVEWVNNSYTNHSATGDSAEKESDNFDTGMVAPKAKSKKILFSKPGVYSYHCRMHGKTMSGQVTVKP